MVKGTTKSGIKYQIDERIKDDIRLYQYSQELTQKDDPQLQSTALFDLLRLVFGGREGLVAFENTVASVHDGVCSPDILMSEFTEIMESLNLKKSSPSHTSSTSARKK